MALTLKTVVQTLRSLAPIQLAANWDNVGLLVEPTVGQDAHLIRQILLTNDLTESVLEEAIQGAGAQLIVSYHPPIFRGLKRLTCREPKERIILKAIENRIAIYSPHTASDSVSGGVTDWLASAFGSSKTTTVEPIKATPPSVAISDSESEPNSFGPNKKAGLGRFVVLDEDQSLEELVAMVKRHVGVPHLRVARCEADPGRRVRTIGVCCGSGADILRGLKADLYLTGELSHHEVLAATAFGAHVILCEHSNSERGYLHHLRKVLSTAHPDANVVVSNHDRDPLQVL